jgi:hypothetical protein
MSFTLADSAALTWVWVAPDAGDRDVDEGAELSFQVPVVYSDENFAPLGLRYGLDSAALAAGMSITPSGAFSWTPAEEQGGAEYPVTVTITDDGEGEPWLSASETFTITVAEANRPPVIDPIADQLADPYSTLTLTATASDPDLPAQGLTFSLDAASLELGMAIDASTGAFSWSPTAAQVAAGPHSVTVTVTDDGENPVNLSDSTSFTIFGVSARAEHEVEEYLDDGTVVIKCTLRHSEERLTSLLWRPQLPEGWRVVAVSGQGGPVIDPWDGSIFFFGYDLDDPNPLQFSCTLMPADDAAGEHSIGATVEFQTIEMVNPATIIANPNPLPLSERASYVIRAVEGESVLSEETLSNWVGVELEMEAETPLSLDGRVFNCLGWTLEIDEEQVDSGAIATAEWELEAGAVLSWLYAAPLIEVSGGLPVTMDEDGEWPSPAITASVPGLPELEDGLVWTLLEGPSGGRLTFDEGDGGEPTISYAPRENWNGEDSFTIMVEDALGGSHTLEIPIVVNPVYDAPKVKNVELYAIAEVLFTLDLIHYSEDVDGDELSFFADENLTQELVGDEF